METIKASEQRTHSKTNADKFGQPLAPPGSDSQNHRMTSQCHLNG